MIIKIVVRKTLFHFALFQIGCVCHIFQNSYKYLNQKRVHGKEEGSSKHFFSTHSRIDPHHLSGTTDKRTAKKRGYRSRPPPTGF